MLIICTTVFLDVTDAIIATAVDSGNTINTW